MLPNLRLLNILIEDIHENDGKNLNKQKLNEKQEHRNS
jgi:hypothetical protein